MNKKQVITILSAIVFVLATINIATYIMPASNTNSNVFLQPAPIVEDTVLTEPLSPKAHFVTQDITNFKDVIYGDDLGNNFRVYREGSLVNLNYVDIAIKNKEPLIVIHRELAFNTRIIYLYKENTGQIAQEIVYSKNQDTYSGISNPIIISDSENTIYFTEYENSQNQISLIKCAKRTIWNCNTLITRSTGFPQTIGFSSAKILHLDAHFDKRMGKIYLALNYINNQAIEVIETATLDQNGNILQNQITSIASTSQIKVKNIKTIYDGFNQHIAYIELDPTTLTNNLKYFTNGNSPQMIESDTDQEIGMSIYKPFSNKVFIAYLKREILYFIDPSFGNCIINPTCIIVDSHRVRQIDSTNNNKDLYLIYGQDYRLGFPFIKKIILAKFEPSGLGTGCRDTNFFTCIETIDYNSLGDLSISI